MNELFQHDAVSALLLELQFQIELTCRFLFLAVRHFELTKPLVCHAATSPEVLELASSETCCQF